MEEEVDAFLEYAAPTRVDEIYAELYLFYFRDVPTPPDQETRLHLHVLNRFESEFALRPHWKERVRRRLLQYASQ